MPHNILDGRLQLNGVEIIRDAVDVKVDEGLLTIWAEEEVTVLVVVHEEVFGEDGEAAIIQSSLGEYVHTEISAAIMLPEDEFDAKWDEIQAFLEASGAGLLEKDISALVKDNIRKRYGG